MIDLTQYLRLLKEYRKIIIFNVVMFLCLAVVLSLFWPKKWRARASFIPAMDVSTPFSEMRRNKTPGLSALLEEEEYFTSTAYMAVMQSRTVMESVVKRAGLKKAFRRKTIEDAIDVLKKSSVIDVDNAEMVTVAVIMPDPKLAAQVVNIWMDVLDSMNISTVRNQGNDEMIFIRSRLDMVKKDLNDALDSLAVFESKYRMFSWADEAKSAIVIYTQLANQLTNQEIELMKWKDASDSLAIKKNLEAEIQNLKAKLRDIEERSSTATAIKAPIKDFPRLQFEYEKRERERSILLDLYNYLLLEYEIAVIKTNLNTSTIIIVDRGIPPEKRMWPSRTVIVLFALMASVLFSMLMVLAMEKVKLRWKR